MEVFVPTPTPCRGPSAGAVAALARQRQQAEATAPTRAPRSPRPSLAFTQRAGRVPQRVDRVGPGPREHGGQGEWLRLPGQERVYLERTWGPSSGLRCSCPALRSPAATTAVLCLLPGAPAEPLPTSVLVQVGDLQGFRGSPSLAGSGSILQAQASWAPAGDTEGSVQPGCGHQGWRGAEDGEDAFPQRPPCWTAPNTGPRGSAWDLVASRCGGLRGAQPRERRVLFLRFP